MDGWIYDYGGADDFEGAPEWARMKTSLGAKKFFMEGHYRGARGIDLSDGSSFTLQDGFSTTGTGTIAIRRREIGPIVFSNKYNRPCKGVTIDVYDVLQAFEVTNPALQHLIKKALCAGLRGHKDREQDLHEILESAKRAIELESK